MRRLILILYTMLMCLGMQAQGVQELPHARKRAVYGDGFYVSPSAYNYSEVARDITQGCTTKYEQAKALYLWICRSISYDTTSDIRNADECWRERKAVCQGYCELFYRLAEPLKLKTVLVYGISKNSEGHREGHSWLSVKTEEGWTLMDPTWGAGSVVNGMFHRINDPLVWFDVDGERFVHTHLPENNKHQHLEEPVTQEGFDTLMYVRPSKPRKA